MEVFYGILADLVVVAHFAYVLFVILGLLAVLVGRFAGWKWTRKFWFRVVHLTMIAIVVVAFGLLGLAGLWLGPLPRLAASSFSAHMALHMGVVALAAPAIALGIAGGRLDLQQAYLFLKEGSFLLKESGYAVLLPAWWGKREHSVGLSLRVTPSPSGTRSVLSPLGLDALVEFDWQVALGGQTLAREEFFELAQLKQPLVRVRGQWVELSPERVDEVLDALNRRPELPRMTLGDVLQVERVAARARELVEEGEDDGLRRRARHRAAAAHHAVAVARATASRARAAASRAIVAHRPV